MQGKPMTNRDIRLLSSKTANSYDNDPSINSNTSSNMNSEQVDEKKKRRITFITDIEGDKNYFMRYVENSKILEWEPVDAEVTDSAANKEISTMIDFPYSHHVVFKHEEDILVCGGDVWDKGGHDLYVLRQLLSLERRYGENRVHFILGNRDLNKIRILQEIGINQSSPLPKFEGVFFLPDLKPPQDNAAERLRWILKNTMGSPNAFEYRRSELLEEQRRKQQSDEEIIVTDEDVVHSYQISCHPITGEMGQYIQKGKFALQLDEILFCHGALPLTPDYIQQNKIGNADNAQSHQNIDLLSFYSYAMPWMNPNASDKTNDEIIGDQDKNLYNIIQSSSDWIDAMNQFKQKQTEVWIQHITEMEQQQRLSLNTDQPNIIAPESEEEYDAWSTHGNYEWESKNKKRSFGSLLQYGMGFLPLKVQNPTVVYNTWMQNGMPLPFLLHDNNKYEHEHDNDDEYENTFCRQFVDTFFEENNLRLILTGHQPIGDMPLPIKVPRTTSSFKGGGQNETNGCRYIICCDTSYSGDTQWIRGDLKNQNNYSNDKNNEQFNVTECAAKNENKLEQGTTQSFRGDVTVCEVLIEQCSESGHIDSAVLHGVLSDGTKYETVNIMDGEDLDIQSIVGRLAQKTDTDLIFEKINNLSQSCEDKEEEEEKRDWWVRGKFLNGDFLVSSGKGYSVTNSIGYKK